MPALRNPNASLVLCFIVALAACAPRRADTPLPDAQPTANADAEVRNIIIMIADGAGVGLWTAASFAEDALAVKGLPVTGLVTTRSGSHKVTDSGAGASVFATGERVTNRSISVGPSSACPLPNQRDTTRIWPSGCERLESWFQLAREKGKATGIVTTTIVVDATPAAFVAHSPSRYWTQEIAAQMAAANLDVMFGGGRRYFAAGSRRDGRDLLGEMCVRSACLSNAGDLAAYRPDARPVVGLFSEGDMDATDTRPVELPTMVERALAKLALDSDGFVAMFETEATDNSTHDNAALDRITADMLEFDRAVGVALDFARRTPGTLLVVTSDHETGGVSLAETRGDFELRYATTGHTAAHVPLFAYGPRAGMFGGLRENYEVGRTLFDIVRHW